MSLIEIIKQIGAEIEQERQEAEKEANANEGNKSL